MLGLSTPFHEAVEQILTSIALVLTPVAAILGAWFAYRAKVKTIENRKYMDTTNGSTLGESIQRIEKDLMEVNVRAHENTAHIAKLRTDNAEHLWRYKHERSLIDE